MPFVLRPYQQEAVNATVDYFRKQTAPAVIVLPTGAGKSLVIAELARLARGRVLVLAHERIELSRTMLSTSHMAYKPIYLPLA